VKALDRVGGVNDPANFLGELEILCKLFPVVAPGLDDSRILGAPFFVKIIQAIFGEILVGGACSAPLLSSHLT
jgi:hypothetical protein